MSTFIPGTPNARRRAGALQAALYHARKHRVERIEAASGGNTKHDTLDPDSLVGGTLSTDKLTFTSDGATNNAGVQSLLKKTSGKWYFEVTVLKTPAGFTSGFGVKDHGAAFSTCVGGLGSHGASAYIINRPIYINGNNPSNVSFGDVVQVGDIIGVGVDVDNHTITVRNWSRSNVTTPAVTMVVEADYVACAFADNNATGLKLQFNFGASAFGGTMFDGFAKWS